MKAFADFYDAPVVHLDLGGVVEIEAGIDAEVDA